MEEHRHSRMSLRITGQKLAVMVPPDEFYGMDLEMDMLTGKPCLFIVASSFHWCFGILSEILKFHGDD